MAGASMNDIRSRIKSVESTMQITKAMELVATSKLRKARERVEKTRPFCDALRTAICNIMRTAEDGELPTAGEELLIVIGGDRGLAGGYNTNIFRAARSLCDGRDLLWLPIGKKAVEYCAHRGIRVMSSGISSAAELGVGEAMRLGQKIYDGITNGSIGRVTVVYTGFVSMMTQQPMSELLYPIESGDKAAGRAPECDIPPQEMLAELMPSYLGGMLYSAVAEASASESGARRSAMNAANKNAEEMIDSLLVKYNRARQSVITQEITEIVSGAEAL